MREPETTEELEMADTAAMFSLCLALAAQYGIMATQAIDVDRCEALIRRHNDGELPPDAQAILADLKRGRIKGA